MPANNRSQTIAFWLSYAAAPEGTRVCVALTQASNGASRLKVGFSAGQLGAFKSSGDALVTTAIPAPGWHHLVYTFDGRDHRLFVDGVIRAMSSTSPDTSAVVNARLGAIFNNAENFLGNLDEVRIYNRALSPAEVTVLAQGME